VLPEPEKSSRRSLVNRITGEEVRRLTFIGR
jgi:hypothetical protein